MATEYANGRISTSNLVLCLDAGDRNSYPTTGTTWTDLAAGRTATITNSSTPFWNSGNGGHFLSGNMGGFDNNTGRINMNTFPTGGISNCTIQCVFMFTASQSEGPQLFAINSATNGVGIQANGGYVLRFFSDSGNRSANSGAVSQDVWNFVSGVRDASNLTMNISVNGGARVTNTYVSIPTITSPTTAWSISREPTTGVVLSGRLAVILYYNRALSREEELINFNALRHRFRI
jgi:hypothetical protein